MKHRIQSTMKAIRLLTLLGLCLSGLGATGAVYAKSAIVEINRIVAVVNRDVITESELNRRIELIRRQLQQQKTPMPPESVLRRQILERLILERIELQMARNLGIRVDDEALNRVLQNIAANSKMSLEQFRAVLERDGYDFAQFREGIRNEVIVKRLRQREVADRVNVTPQEVDEFLASQKNLGNLNQEYHLSHILIAVPEAASPEQVQAARAKAEEVLSKLRAGADFREMAVSYSDGQQALQGGDLGWRKAGQLPTLFSDILTRMHPGEISDLIRSPSGFHILKVTEERGEKKHIVRQTHARHILIRTNEVTSDYDARTRLERLRQRILAGEDFSTLAKANSDDRGSASKGGDLGWANPGDFVPAFEEVITKLAPGAVSEPFKTQFGWHIVQVLGRRDYDNTEQYQRARARQALRARKIDERLQQWVRRIRDEAYVEYRLEG